jgi:hypothetical protein
MPFETYRSVNARAIVNILSLFGLAADRGEAALPANPAATFCGQDSFPRKYTLIVLFRLQRIIYES